MKFTRSIGFPRSMKTETEGRKYGLKLIQGTQGKTQYEEYYDRLAKAMLAAPKLKIFFRCGESESARWISDTIGEYEVEKPKIGTTASVEDKGRDAVNYSTVTEHKQAISKEEIMSLPDLHGYWKYADVVVPFRLPLTPVKIRARGYVAREIPPIKIQLPRRQKLVSETHEGSNDQTSGRKATQDARTSIAPSKTKRSKRAAKGGKRDAREHEHLMTERENRLETALGVNLVEEATMEIPNQGMTPDSDITMNSESRPIALEIGEIDEELEQAQIVL